MSTQHDESKSGPTLAEVWRESFWILPLCPLAKEQIKRHPEWQDVL